MLGSLAGLLGSGGSSLIVYAVIVFGLLAGGFAEGYHIASDHAKAQQLDAEKRVETAVAAEAAKNQAASAKLEEQRSAQHAKAQIVTRTVDRIVERPVYRNVCFDADGVLIVNAAIAGTPADPSQPDKPVPSTGAAH
jgi:hypothetical protein